MTKPPQIDADDLEVPEELRDFANMMVEEVMVTLRAKILNGGWSPSEQTEVLDCVIAEQKVKHEYRNALTTLRAEKQALVDANTQPPQIDADELERLLLRKHDVQSGIAQCRLKNPDGISAVAALTTLRAEKQALVDANTRLLHEINAHKDALADAEGTISELQSALRDS